MKVGINARTFGVSDPEGAVQVAIKQTKQLVRGEDIEVVLFGPESTNEVFPRVQLDSTGYRTTSSQFFGVLWERSVVPWLARKHDIDVLYCPNGNGPLTELSCPIVVCVHDVNAQLGMSSPVHQLYRKLTVPRSTKTADSVVTVSDFSKRELCRVLGLPPSKVEVVNNGVDEIFHSDTAGEPFELPDEYVLFVGSLNPRKNIERIVDSFKRVKQETDVPHKLVLAGPPNRMIFKDIELDTSESITHVGFLSVPELKYAYENATVFVYPSLYEGFGLPPLEAMACGTAVLASDLGPFPETLGSAAELVDPYSTEEISDRLRRLLLDVEYREEFEAKGMQRSKDFTWERAGTQLKHVLGKAVNQ